ncbi:MAG: 3-deoxy-manno-octulosonate cytidylyltransferase [Rhodospirillales bacterium]
MKTIGVVPARMAASRFPGKPLKPILGRPMIEHCFRRAQLYDGWDGLFLATCDEEIRAFGEDNGFPVLMTGAHHRRALDRTAEAAEICGVPLSGDDIVVCVQGDEPLLGPDMIEAVVAPLRGNNAVEGTILAVPVIDRATFENPDIVKLVHDVNGDVLYTSRAPVPYMKTFSPEGGALRVGGIFGFRWDFLRWFTQTPESPLEISEACDSNRILDNARRQRAAVVPHRPYVSVDSPEDIARAEAAMQADSLSGGY